mmetsp:Transcript_75957/g.122674  ORF Transcript_75957/g.122674 Transcript_75957/m.122674 type:complete len:94 (-) Transcript_75957:595-876(-)
MQNRIARNMHSRAFQLMVTTSIPRLGIAMACCRRADSRLPHARAVFGKRELVAGEQKQHRMQLSWLLPAAVPSCGCNSCSHTAGASESHPKWW